MQITDGDDAREAIRGTTALVDGARLAYALWKLDDEAAKPICDRLQIPFERGRIVRGAVVKANDETDHSAHTYRREDFGIAVQLESEPQSGKSSEPTFSIDQAREVLKEVDRRFEAGRRSRIHRKAAPGTSAITSRDSSGSPDGRPSN